MIHLSDVIIVDRGKILKKKKKKPFIFLLMPKAGRTFAHHSRHSSLGSKYYYLPPFYPPLFAVCYTHLPIHPFPHGVHATILSLSHSCDIICVHSDPFSLQTAKLPLPAHKPINMALVSTPPPHSFLVLISSLAGKYYTCHSGCF